MNMNSMKKMLSVVLCMVLIAAMALNFTGCGQEQAPEVNQVEEKTFTFVAVDLEGKETSFTVTTTEDTVGAALLAEGLIEGEPGPYGLYVKTVNGITLDYNKDGQYWAFYENDQYGMTGVDQTEIVPGTVYTFKPE